MQFHQTFQSLNFITRPTSLSLRWKMPVFVIIRQKSQNSDKLPAAIERTYAGNNMQISDEAWLVSAKTASPKEVSDALGVTDGSNGTAIIVEFDSYFGRAPTNIWAWIKDKIEESANG
jgi:hypothetical protein